jgi:uncharacterized protein (TIGR02996 family)
VSEEAAFLAAIREHPDDTPRLAYADWLQEHERAERAEFIRAQIGLTHLPDGDPRRGDLEIAERRLLAKHAVEWSAPWPPFNNWEYAGADGLCSVFRRGFLEEVPCFAMPGGTSGDSFAELCAAHPISRVIVYAPEYLRPLIGRPETRRLDSLTLYRHSIHETNAQRRTQIAELTAFLQHADLARLRRWNFGLSGVSEDTLVGWLRLPVARQLVSLRVGISSGQPTGELMRELARNDFPDLRELQLVSGNSPDFASEARRFVETDAWKRLTALTFVGRAFPWARGLDTAKLSLLMVNLVDDAAYAAFIAGLASAPPTIEELTLQGSNARGENLSRVLNAPGLANLRRLYLQGMELTDDDLARLAASPVLAHLNRLSVRLNHRAGSDVEPLFAVDMPRMTHLRLSWGSVRRRAIRALARNASARRLRELRVSSLTDPDSIRELVAGEPFPELHTFGFGCYPPNPDAAMLYEFLDSPKLPRLCVVPFSTDDNDVERLAKVFRACGRIAWAGGEMVDGGDGVRVAVVPENVYLPNHLDDFEAY